MALISNGTTIASGGALSVSTTPTTSQVLSATAGATAGSVGAYIFARASAGTRNKNSTYASNGGNFHYSNASGNQGDGVTAGTYRLMGRTNAGSTVTNHATVWVRVS